MSTLMNSDGFDQKPSEFSSVPSDEYLPLSDAHLQN